MQQALGGEQALPEASEPIAHQEDALIEDDQGVDIGRSALASGAAKQYQYEAQQQLFSSSFEYVSGKLGCGGNWQCDIFQTH
jgi:hypothetical protein